MVVVVDSMGFCAPSMHPAVNRINATKMTSLGSMSIITWQII